MRTEMNIIEFSEYVLHPDFHEEEFYHEKFLQLNTQFIEHLRMNLNKCLINETLVLSAEIIEINCVKFKLKTNFDGMIFEHELIYNNLKNLIKVFVNSTYISNPLINILSLNKTEIALNLMAYCLVDYISRNLQNTVFLDKEYRHTFLQNFDSIKRHAEKYL